MRYRLRSTTPAWRLADHARSITETADREVRRHAWSSGWAAGRRAATRPPQSWSSAPWWTACRAARPSCTRGTRTPHPGRRRARPSAAVPPAPRAARAARRTASGAGTPSALRHRRSTARRPGTARTRARRRRAPRPPRPVRPPSSAPAAAPAAGYRKPATSRGPRAWAHPQHPLPPGISRFRPQSTSPGH